MSYRGFTWNLTATEMAHVQRILAEHMRCDTCFKWDAVIADHLLKKIEMVLEVSPDGTSPTHARADA